MPHYRTRTGCLTCRGRKKKCDEKRPNCSGCVRNHLNCSWSLQANRLPLLETGGPQPLSEPEDNIEPKYKAAVRWNTRSVSFLANERACLTLPISPALLQHYICETGILLPAATDECNPFIAYIVPLAYADDLLMHAVLCLSATHLSCKQGNTLEIEKAISVHYTTLLKNIRNEIGDLTVAEHRKLLTLLIILVFISYYEAASGDVSGSMFTHLRASRQLILHLHQQQQTHRSADRKLLAFAMELYAYTVCVNTLIPFGLIPARTIAYDYSLLIFDELVEYESFGVMFTGLQELYELIPRISYLASLRLEEEKLKVKSERCQTMFENLSNEIESFKLFMEPPSDHGGCLQYYSSEKTKAAEMYRHALHIFLKGSMAGSTVDDEVRDQLQERAVSIMNIAKTLQTSRITSSLLWPIIIAGSCLIDRHQQSDYVMQMSNTKYNMYHLLQGCKLLQLLWNDEDPCCFGSYGLYLTMKKHSINLALF